MRLDEAIDAYLRSREGMGYAKNTVRASRQALDLLLLTVGNVHVKNLTTTHGELFVSAMLSKGFKPGTVNLYRGAVVRFIKWAQHRRMITTNPLATTRSLSDPKPPRRRVPAKDFPHLLDCADAHQQDRIIVALGLYLFLRASEISALDVEHVDLDAGEVKVYQPKTKRWDVMPICAELDAELRRWLAWYADDQARAGRGPLLPHWPLVPSRRVSNLFGRYPLDGEDREKPGQMNPQSRCTQIHNKVKAALTKYGWEVTADDREGVHTLRRSGARALFDELVDSGRVRDGALRVVQAMLHHRSVVITEGYLGLEADVERRNAMFKGATMFAQPDRTNVVSIDGRMNG